MQYASSATPITQLNNIPTTMKAFKYKNVLAVYFITYNHFKEMLRIKFIN